MNFFNLEIFYTNWDISEILINSTFSPRIFPRNIYIYMNSEIF